MVRTNVAEILTNHVTFELEAIDRMYLNAYIPSLQTGGGFVWFVKTQLGARVPSTMMVAPMSQQFVDAIERFVDTEGVDLVTFEKGQRKDDVAQQYLAAGFVDEFELHVVPILLGDGERLLEKVGDLKLEQMRAVEAPGVTHIKYRVTN